VVPEAAHLGERGWADLEALVERAVASRPAALRRQLRFFLRLLQWMPLFRYARTLTALDPARRARFLAGVQDSRVLLLRRGFWGVRTLVLLGYYTRPGAAEEIGYRAPPGGWEARRATEADA
ncbi:MAG: hypothetical protein ACREKI_01070, partial [Gemmatimonadota bacterium]